MREIYQSDQIETSRSDVFQRHITYMLDTGMENLPSQLSNEVFLAFILMYLSNGAKINSI